MTSSRPAAYNPLAIGWEKSVLGSVLAEPERMEEALEQGLLPYELTGCHQELWGEMIALYRRGALELRALIESLRSRQRLETMASFDTESRGEAYIAELFQYRGDALPEYVRQVIAFATRREARKLAALIAADADDDHVPIEEALDSAEKRLLALRKFRDTDMGVQLGTVVEAFMSRTDAFLAGTYQPAWVPNLLPMRLKMQFLEETDYVVFAARPGQGKSSYWRWEAVESAQRGCPVAIFNLENGEVEYARYAIAMVTGINSERLRNPRLLSERERERVREAADTLMQIPLYIKSLGSPSVAEIERLARPMISKLNLRLVIVDYVQLIQNGLQNRVQDVGLSSRTLRGMAMSYHVPFVACSQMSRAIEHRRGDEAEPQLSDLRETGELEQDATHVVFPVKVQGNINPGQFPENLNERGQLVSVDDYPAIPVRFLFKKNRNGPIGPTEPALWDRSTNRYRPLTRPRDVEPE